MDYRIRWRQRRLERRRQRLLAVPLGLLLGLALFVLLRGLGGETVIWAHQGPARYTPHFALGPSALYVTWPDGHLEAVRLGDGRTHRDTPLFSLPEPLNSAPSYANQTICFATDLGAVYAIHSATGDQLWEFRAGGAVRDTPVRDGPRLYFGDDAGRLYCLAAGAPVWSTDLGAAIAGGVARVGDVLVAATTAGVAYGLKPGDGRLLWRRDLGEPIFAPVTAAAPLVFVGSDLGTAFFLDAATGAVAARYRTRGMIRGPAAVNDQQVCFGSTDGWLRVVSRDGRIPLWSFDLGGPVTVGPVLAGGRYYAAQPRRLVALDASTGRQVCAWKEQGLAGGLAATADTVYAGAANGRILALVNP